MRYRGVGLVLAVAALAALPAVAAEAPYKLDPRIMAHVSLKDVKWEAYPVKGATQYKVFGDSEKPGPYMILIRWAPGAMSRPHCHLEERYVTVLQGTWWVGEGPKFEPGRTVPMPAGTVVTHHANGLHYDGAKGEPAIIEIVGMGPASTLQPDKCGR
ncbi:MAG: cupin domain-containing protein [Caulobacteraceae bacterium]